ncbi:MAG: LysR substrate-binding domain-containing protein [Bacilli bacterium]
MDYKQLVYFVEIVNAEFNLSRAAKNMHITQPSLSMMIHDLENTNQIKFFKKKNSRYIGLTSEGEILFDEARKIINDMNSLNLKLEKIKKKHNGTVTIGIPPIIISLFFNKLITQFIAKYPDINIEIVEEGANVLRKMLKKKQIDFAILVDDYGLDETLEYCDVCKDTLSAFVNNEHKYAKNSSLCFTDLEDEKLVLLSDSFVLHTVILNKFKEKGIVPNIIFTSGQWDLLTQMVQDENVITILPNSLELKVRRGALSVIDFLPKLKWAIALSRNKNAVETPSAILLREFILDFYKK